MPPFLQLTFLQWRHRSHWPRRHGVSPEIILTLSNPISKGQNLILNMNDKGFNVVAYNRTTSKVDNFLANEAKGELFAMIYDVNDH